MLCDPPLDAACAILKKAMDGLGTDEITLSFIIGGIIFTTCSCCKLNKILIALVGASKLDAPEICQRYFAKYDKSLIDRLASEISGNYLKAMTSYLTSADPTLGLEEIIENGGATEDVYRQAYLNVKQSIADMDAYLLNFANSGMSTDQSLIIDVMCNKTKDELEAIDMSFRNMFKNKTLKSFVNSAMGGDLAEFMAYIQMDENEFDSYILHKAFKGIGCNKDLVCNV